MKYLQIFIIIWFFAVNMTAQYDSLEVNSIEFAGNEFFSSGTLFDNIKTKESNLFETFYLEESVLELDLQNLKNFYNNEGFFDVIIDGYDINIIDEGTEAEITFTIIEGKPYFIKSIKFTGNEFFSDNEILDNLPINLNDRFQYFQLKASEITIKKMMYNNGFLDANISSDFVQNRDKYSVDIEFKIIENTRFKINEINIEGTEITDSYVVKRELEFNAGEYIDLGAITFSKRKLYRTDLFRSVTIKSQDAVDSSLSKKDIIINLLEEDPGDFEISVGYGTIEKLRSSSSISYDNILGEAYKAKLEGKISSIEKKAELTLTDPWAFGLPLGISLVGTYREIDEPSYDMLLYEGSVNFNKEFNFLSKIGLALKYNISTFDNLKFSLIEGEDVAQDLTQEEYEALVIFLENLKYVFHRAGLKLSLHHDLRDNIFNPSSGFLFDLSSEFIYGDTEIDFFGIHLGNSINRLLKNEFVIDYFHPLFDFATLASSLQLGIINNFTPDRPQYFVDDLFYAGGPSSLRGFGFKEVGPLNEDRIPLGGQLKIVWNLFEIRARLFWLFDAAFFMDLGNIWKNIDDLKLKDIRYSPGLGLRVDSPVGLIRFDYGFNPWPKPGESAGQYWIGIGHAF